MDRQNCGIEKRQLCRILANIVSRKRIRKGLHSQRHEGPERVTCIAPISSASALDVN